MKLTVLYGTETGNCKGLAQKVAKKGQKNGVDVEVIDLADYTVEQFTSIDNPTLVIISTWDEGAPPPKCVPFVSALLESSADLSKMQYTVLALGDKEYLKFCECGKQIDEKLQALGAERVQDRADLGADYLFEYMGWSKSFWKTMAKVYGVAA